MKTSTRQHLALVLVGLVAGALGALAGVRAVTADATPAGHSQVTEAALACGVYGLPGSPATVVLTAGADGHPIGATIESDIFGGDEIEACVLGGVAAMPMNGGSARIALPVHQPEGAEGALASR